MLGVAGGRDASAGGSAELGGGGDGAKWGVHARLERIDRLLEWTALAVVVAPIYAAPTGRPSHPPLLMVKALLLQQGYGLSDPGLEEALADRLSFRRCVGLSSGATAGRGCAIGGRRQRGSFPAPVPGRQPAPRRGPDPPTRAAAKPVPSRDDRHPRPCQCALTGSAPRGAAPSCRRGPLRKSLPRWGRVGLRCPGRAKGAN